VADRAAAGSSTRASGYSAAGGTPFLPPVTEDIPLELIESRTFDSRVIYERDARPR
jgi:hypothetical protein